VSAPGGRKATSRLEGVVQDPDALTYNHMVVDVVEDVRSDLLFRALADATRRDIVALVLRQEHSVSALARRYPMSFAAVQKHVAVLERAQLVVKVRRGREQLVRGNVDAVRDASRTLDRLEAVWRHRMDRFGELLAEPDEGARS
jgi:DNA-binding transcriptional ArsR family regulator